MNTALGRYPFILLVFLGFFFRETPGSAQPTALTAAYSHNDYWHKRPFHDALGHGFTHMEVDIFLYHGHLVVAHTLPLFKRQRSLEDLYLKPIQHYIESRKREDPCAMDTLLLMIDIKSEGEKTLLVLKSLLEKYRPYLSSYENGQIVRRSLTIVLTGHRPLMLLQNENDRLFFVDENLRQVNKDELFQHLYTVASCKYSKILKWKGKGSIPEEERSHLLDLVTKAHLYGKKVRLWASPENESVWSELLACGVDLINTDQLEALRRFFIDRNKASLATADRP
jgi:hypothetical protein